jgi:hypothetical protein
LRPVTQDRPSEIERIFVSDSTAHVYGGKWVKGRGVCEQCNGGWMSNLESKIKPILEPMIFRFVLGIGLCSAVSDSNMDAEDSNGVRMH